MKPGVCGVSVERERGSPQCERRWSVFIFSRKDISVFLLNMFNISTGTTKQPIQLPPLFPIFYILTLKRIGNILFPNKT